MAQIVIPMHQAKSNLSQLVKRASGGEDIYIGTYGCPQALLTSAAHARPKKKLGLLEGKLIVPEDFDAPLPPDILAGFEFEKGAE